jgi:hypothetical protein
MCKETAATNQRIHILQTQTESIMMMSYEMDIAIKDAGFMSVKEGKRSNKTGTQMHELSHPYSCGRPCFKGDSLVNNNPWVHSPLFVPITGLSSSSISSVTPTTTSSSSISLPCPSSPSPSSSSLTLEDSLPLSLSALLSAAFFLA